MERRAAGWWTYMRGFCPCCEVFRGAYRVEIKFNLLLLKIKKTCCVVARTKNLKKEQIFVHPVRTYTFRGRGREGRLLLLFGIARVIRGSIGFVCTHLLTVYKSITRVKSARFPMQRRADRGKFSQRGCGFAAGGKRGGQSGVDDGDERSISVG